jgi:aromatic-L-amino-acid/L-tryptophan decarboxylase
VNADEFRTDGHQLVEWIADYLEHSDRYPVLSRVAPGDVRRALPTDAPRQPESFDAIFTDFERIILPGITHWNHPGFLAYFAITGSAPGVLAEFLSAALNVQAMLWRTSPAATELEEVTLGWLRRLLNLPEPFEGVIYDTASIASLHALAAARQAAIAGVNERGLLARSDVPPQRLYCSEHAHSSIDKAVMLLGFGREALRRIPADDQYRMRVEALEAAVLEDRAAGIQPLAAIATVGTTSTTSIDPVPAIADVCARHGLWLHVDAAYAGVAAMVPGCEATLAGCDRADSLVVNPHKWLFTPFDLSVLYTRRMADLRAAFSLTPEYLRTTEARETRNLMDTGIQLGRRFRSLKLWMVMRHFGSDALRARLSEHMRLARLFAEWIDADPSFERLAPVPFSVVCFRARPPSLAGDAAALDDLNERLLDRVNASGEVFMSHTRLHGLFTIRLAIGHLRTAEAHVRRAYDLLRAELGRL